MKRVVELLISAALALAVCTGFVPRCRAQTLEVHESGTGTGTVDHWRPYWGSYNRDYHQTKKIRITVRDTSRRSPDGEVRVYFIGRKQPQLDLFIYNHTILPVHFGGDMEVRHEIDAPSLFLNEKRYWDGDHYSHGAAMEGWIAEGRVGSRVFGTAASNQNLLGMSKADALQKMIAAAGIREVQPNAQSSSPVAMPAPTELPSVPQAPSPSLEQTAVVNRKVQAQTPRGEIIIPLGMQIRVVARQGETLQVSYMGWTITIPASATDLK